MGLPINENLTEAIAFLGAAVYPTLTTAQVGGKTDLSKVRKVAYLFQAGTLAAAETVTCKLQGSVTSAGSFTDIAGSTATLVKATDDNKAVVIEIDSESLNELGLGYRFVQYSVAAAVGSPVAVFPFGGGGPEEPISAQNAASIKSLTVL